MSHNEWQWYHSVMMSTNQRPGNIQCDQSEDAMIISMMPPSPSQRTDTSKIKVNGAIWTIITVIFWWNRSCARYSSTFSFDDVMTLILICPVFWVLNLIEVWYDWDILPWQLDLVRDNTLASFLSSSYPVFVSQILWPITSLEMRALSNQHLVVRTQQLTSFSVSQKHLKKSGWEEHKRRHV